MAISNTPLLATPVSALDFFIPQSTYYNETTGPVKHVRSWSKWRGLSSFHAEELAICELAFRQAIQEKIFAYVDGFLSSSTTQDNVFTIKVNLIELSMRIMDVFFDSCLSPSPLLNLPNVVQFVRLHDCFVRPPTSRPFVDTRTARLRVQTSQESRTPTITTYSPRLVFDDLIVQVEEGQNYYLRPRYIPPLGGMKCSDPHLTYTTGNGWLRYNEEKAYFAGTVPRGSPTVLEITVEAKVVHVFPGTPVRHEELIQASVTILRIALGDNFEHTKPSSAIKQVRFAEVPLILRSQNSFSVLEDCSNMDQTRQRMAPSSASDNATLAYTSPGSEFDKTELLGCSPLCSPCHEYLTEEAVTSSHLASNEGLSSEPSDSKSGSIDDNQFGKAAARSPRNMLPNMHNETDDDGISAQIRENVRKITDTMEFDPREDPRDVREMKKDLLQIRLRDLSREILGFQIDRWSNSEGGSGLSDILEPGEDSALENSLRESIGY